MGKRDLLTGWESGCFRGARQRYRSGSGCGAFTKVERLIDEESRLLYGAHWESVLSLKHPRLEKPFPLVRVPRTQYFSTRIRISALVPLI